jgi:4-amino-4-deoxy-L-arabinose transferase-like glycosyltransferase
MQARVGLGLVVFATALRLPLLALRRLVEGDGVHYAHLARSILAGDLSGLANPYWSNLWPAAIAATALATGLDVVPAGRVLSLVAGVLLVLATAALAARLFDRTTGLVAGLLCAAHPWLIHFSTLVFTESLFALLLVGLLLAGLRASESGRWAAAAGVIGGAALLTRPEAYAAILVVLALILRGATRPPARPALVRAAAFAAIVALSAAGRAALVHRYHGLWDFGVGTKGTANLFIGLARSDREMERVATEVGSDGRNALAQRAADVTLAGFARAHPALLARHVGANLVRLTASGVRVFPLLPLTGGQPLTATEAWPLRLALAGAMVGLAGFGMARALRDPATRVGAAALAATTLLHLLGLAPLFVHDRLVVALVPLFLVFLAHGAVRAARALPAGEPAVRRSLTSLAALAGVFFLATLLHASTLDYAGDPVIQRETGRWLAARYPPDTRVMAAGPAVGFYFYDAAHADNEVPLPWGDADEVVDLARRQDVALLVVPEWHLRAVGHPAAPVLLHPDTPHAGLRPLAALGDDAKGRMFVYAVEPGGGGRP